MVYYSHIITHTTSHRNITVISRKNLTHFLFNEFFNEKHDYESNIIKYEFLIFTQYFHLN